MSATATPPVNEASVPRPLDPKMILPFVNSTQRVLRTMVKVDVKIGKPYFKTDAVATHDISGIIGFSGTLLGSVIVTMQKSVAEALVTALNGVPVPYESRNFVDAIGEIANMIAGSAKRDLEAGANISIPTVIMGAGHMIARLSGVPCIVIPCHTPAGDFAIEVNVKPL